MKSVLNLDRLCGETRRPLVMVLGVIVLWLALIWPELSVSLWLDEGASWWAAHRSFLSAVTDTFPYPPHPAYYGALNLFMALFGESERVMRLLSVAFFLHSALLLGSLARGLVPKIERGTLFLCVVTAFLSSSSLLSLCLQARPYAMTVWASLLSFSFLIKAFSERRKTFHLVGFVVASVLAISAHAVMVFLPLLHLCLFWAIEEREKNWCEWRHFSIAVLLGAVLSAGILSWSGMFDFLPNLSSDYPGSTSDVNWVAFVYLTLEPAVGVGIFSSLLVLLLSMPPTKGSFRASITQAKKCRGSLFLFAWSTIPSGALLALRVVSGETLTERYIVLGTIVIPLAVGILAAVCFTSSRLIIRPLGVLLLLLSYGGISFKPFALPREQWREMSAWISERATPESVVIVRPGHLRSESSMIQDPIERRAWMAIATYYGLGSRVPTDLFTPSYLGTQGDWAAAPFSKNHSSIFLLCRNLPTNCDEIVARFFVVSGYQLIDAQRSRWVSAYQWRP